MQVAAVFAHPDDESISAAGLLCRCARAGARVTVVCATRGERGRRAQPVQLERDLADVRSDELRAACAALGADAPVFLELPDGELATTKQTDAAIAEALLTIQPDLIVTHGADGMYAHRDHVAVSAAVSRAVSDALSGQPAVLHCQFPSGLLVPLWRRIRHRAPELLEPDIGEQELGIVPSTADLRLDVGDDADTKLTAIYAHQSQVNPGDESPLLMPGLLEHVLAVELYTVVAGSLGVLEDLLAD